MKQLYALVTTNCNLSCSHCDIKSINDSYNEEKFLEAIDNFDGNVTLFGGEPTLYKDRLLKILELGKATSISTNMLNIDDDIIYKLQEHNVNIATSWNYSRFDNAKYHRWIKALEHLGCDWHISCKVLITLTEDLINSNPKEFIEMIKFWSYDCGLISSILFEQLIDDSKLPEFYEKVDDWLCEVYKLWPKKPNLILVNNEIIDKLDHWYCDCSNTYTLHPNGIITNGCPHSSGVSVSNECLICSQSDKCMPCRLQQYCTYPKKLSQLVKKEKGIFK